MSKAAIYARKSKATEKGASVENQINKCKAHLNNLDITDILNFNNMTSHVYNQSLIQSMIEKMSLN